MPKSDPVPATAVWVRNRFQDKDGMRHYYIEVLIEVDGQWRKVIRTYYEPGQNELSWINEARTWREAPIDDLAPAPATGRQEQE